MSGTEDNHWHLDKRVPIALILTLAAQFGAGVWFTSKLAQRQDEHERRIQVIEQVNVSARISAVEGQLMDLKDGVRRIDGKLDRLIERKH